VILTQKSYENKVVFMGEQREEFME